VDFSNDALAARFMQQGFSTGSLGVMVRDTLQEIATLLERHNASSNDLAIALLGDNEEMWRYLVSNELWEVQAPSPIRQFSTFQTPGGSWTGC